MGELKSKELVKKPQNFSIAMVTRSPWMCCVDEWQTFPKYTLRMLTCDLWAAVSHICTHTHTLCTAVMF